MQYRIIKSFANFVRNDFFCLQRSYRSAFENHDFDDYNISETITTTKTTIIFIYFILFNSWMSTWKQYTIDHN